MRPMTRRSWQPTWRRSTRPWKAWLRVLVDSGFLSEEAVNSIECNEKGESTAVRVLAAVKRDRHGRRVADLEKKDDPRSRKPGRASRSDGAPGGHQSRGGNRTSRGNKQLA